MTRRMVYQSMDEFRRGIGKLPKAVKKELKEAGYEMTREVASEAASEALGLGRQAKHVASKIRPRRQKEPQLVMTGKSAFKPSSGRRGARTSDIMWGAEFGGSGYSGRRSSGANPVPWNLNSSSTSPHSTTRQFLPHKGRTGYFLWPTIRQFDFIGPYRDALFKAMLRMR